MSKQRFNKMMKLCIALLLCMGFFIAPTTVFAEDNGQDAGADITVQAAHVTHVAPPTVEAEILGSLLRIRTISGFFAVEAVYINGRRFNHRVDSALVVDISQYIATDNTIAIQAVDFAGNYSDTVLLSPPPPAQPPIQNNFTPEGQGEIQDSLTDGDGIEFFTITTEAGNVFHLIIDHTRSSNNVFFLNAVTEWDLLTLAADAELAIPPNIAPPTPPPPIVVEHEPPPVVDEPEPEPTPEPIPKDSGGRMGTFIFLGIGGAGAFGVIYYLKILKPKQEQEMYGGENDADAEAEADEYEDVDEADPENTEGD